MHFLKFLFKSLPFIRKYHVPFDWGYVPDELLDFLIRVGALAALVKYLLA